MSEQDKNLTEAAEAAAPAEKEKAVKKASATAPKKAAKDTKKKGIGSWFKDLKGEMKKIVWPTREHTVKNTVTVIAMSLIVGAFIWIFDGVAITAVKTLISVLG